MDGQTNRLWDLFHMQLTHWGRMTHICVGKINIIGSDNGLSPRRRQAIIQSQCWNIVNWTLGNKPQWNFNRNSNIFIQENEFESVVWKMAAILSRPQCVKRFIIGYGFDAWGIVFTKLGPSTDQRQCIWWTVCNFLGCKGSWRIYGLENLAPPLTFLSFDEHNTFINTK